MGKPKTPKYNGLTEEDVKAQQNNYNTTISLLQAQNAKLTADAATSSKAYQDGYNEKLSLLSQQLQDQRTSYDSLLASSQSQTRESQARATQLEGQYQELGKAQADQSSRVRAEAERTGIQSSDATSRLVRKQTQRTQPGQLIKPRLFY